MQRAQMRYIGSMIAPIAKILDPFGQMFARLQMVGGMAIALGPGVNQ